MKSIFILRIIYGYRYWLIYRDSFVITSCLSIGSVAQLIKNVEASFGFAAHDHAWLFQEEVGNFAADRLSAQRELHLDIFPLQKELEESISR